MPNASVTTSNEVILILGVLSVIFVRIPKIVLVKITFTATIRNTMTLVLVEAKYKEVEGWVLVARGQNATFVQKLACYIWLAF